MTDNKLSFDYGDTKISFRIIRRNRRTMEISVLPNLQIEVVAPLGAAQEKILARVRKRASWIKKQLRFFHQFQPRTPERQYVPGETHLYLGRQYRLKVLQNHRGDGQPRVRLRGGFIEVHSDYPKRKNVTRELVDAWLKQRAGKKFAERLEICVGRFPKSDAYRPVGMIVRQMRKRWGSMTASRRLILNSILVQAPVDAIDYVIHHELCHVAHNHHGAAFIDLLELVMPDWERRKMKLDRILA